MVVSSSYWHDGAILGQLKPPPEFMLTGMRYAPQLVSSRALCCLSYTIGSEGAVWGLARAA
jgi:hypothetical protein